MVEKLLIAQKDDEIQAALLRTDEEREKLIDQFLKYSAFLTFNSPSIIKALSSFVDER